VKQIIEVKWDNNLSIMKSIEVKDAGEYYEVKFQHPPYGYIRTEPYIKKSDLIDPKPYKDMIENKLYVNAERYNEDPGYWQDLVKNFRELHDVRKWLKFK
jgi:hypothetical protein